MIKLQENNNHLPKFVSYAALLGMSIFVLGITVISSKLISSSSTAPLQTYAFEKVSAQSGSQIYWGARMDGEVYNATQGDAPWDNNTWNTFETHAGKKASIIHWGVTYPSSIRQHASVFQKVKDRGAISLANRVFSGITRRICTGNSIPLLRN